jgi:hypothetical protein
MPPARGDRKPCTRTACSGTMQFGREPLLQTSSAMRPDTKLGWICSENPSHFALASALDVTAAPRARWDDDGGAAPGEDKIAPRI